MMLQFRGPLANVIDPKLGELVSPRCAGEARIEAANPASYQAAVGQAGGEEAFGNWIKAKIVNHLATSFRESVEADGVMRAIGATHLLAGKVTQNVNRELVAVGAAVQIGSIGISLPPGDVERLKAAAAEAARSAQPAPAAQAFTPGTHVIARWSDGREFGATIRGWNGTHYEIAWDGGSASAFVTRDAVRAG
jgi:hypothetical protein